MPFVAPDPNRNESILMTSQEGIGKTYAQATVANYLQVTNTPVAVHILAGDTGWDITLSHGSPFNATLNPTQNPNSIIKSFQRPRTWEQWDKGIAWLLQCQQLTNPQTGELFNPAHKEQGMVPVAPGHWIMIDAFHQAWGMAQDYFTSMIYGKDLGGYWMQKRLQMEQERKGGIALFNQKNDWGPMRKLWFDVAYPLFNEFRCHLFVTEIAKKMFDAKTDDSKTEMDGLYAYWGWKPAGHPSDGEQATSVLFMKRGACYERLINTVKDRFRNPFQNHVLNDFANEYLIERAGWKVV